MLYCIAEFLNHQTWFNQIDRNAVSHPFADIQAWVHDLAGSSTRHTDPAIAAS